MTPTITVYDRVYLSVPGKTLVIELLDGRDRDGTYVDAWRLIDLNTSEEFARDVQLHEVMRHASKMSCEAQDDHYLRYIEGRAPDVSYRLFKDLPLAVRLKWITSHAGDLEHDFKLDGDTRDPIAVATQELNDMYNEKPCFYLDRQTGQWELDCDRC